MQNSREQIVGDLLLKNRLTLALAESCTGGLLGSRITDVAGSSEYFTGGVVAYSDRLKVELLRVPPALIREHGAVSAQCALAMSRMVRELTGADVGLSVTGIAGPGGGTEAKPVGTVFIGLCGPGFETVQHYQWRGDRDSNKRMSCDAALDLLAAHLLEVGPTSGRELTEMAHQGGAS